MQASDRTEVSFDEGRRGRAFAAGRGMPSARATLPARWSLATEDTKACGAAPNEKLGDDAGGALWTKSAVFGTAAAVDRPGSETPRLATSSAMSGGNGSNS